MKLLICGGRDFTNYQVFKEIMNGFKLNKNIEFVSGHARGTDTLAEMYANEFGYPLKIFPADWDKYGKRAGILRNIEMGNYCDNVVAFYNGYSKGTGHMINYAKEKGKKVIVFTYKNNVVLKGFHVYNFK